MGNPFHWRYFVHTDPFPLIGDSRGALKPQVDWRSVASPKMAVEEDSHHLVGITAHTIMEASEVFESELCLVGSFHFAKKETLTADYENSQLFTSLMEVVNISKNMCI